VHGCIVVLRIAEELARYVSIPIGMLQGQPAEAIRDGFQARIGWGPFRLREADGGELRVETPDYAALGGAWTDDLTLAVSMLVRQWTLHRLIGVDEDPPLFLDRFVLEEGADAADEVVFSRGEPSEPGDSGWFLGLSTAGERRPLTTRPIADLLALRPRLTGFIALPPGHLVSFRGDEVQALVDPDDRDVWPRD